MIEWKNAPYNKDGTNLQGYTKGAWWFTILFFHDAIGWRLTYLGTLQDLYFPTLEDAKAAAELLI